MYIIRDVRDLKFRRTGSNIRAYYTQTPAIEKYRYYVLA